MAEREIVTMLVEPHEGNEAGEVRVYRDELSAGAAVKEDAPQANVDDVSRMTKAQLNVLLDERGIERSGNETKAELVELAVA